MVSARRRGRLSRSAEFERAYRQGRSLGNRHLVLYEFANAGSERPRLGLSVSRKVGGAVERNHVKRLLREAFAEAEARMDGGHDVVIVARPEARELAEREGLAGIRGCLGELIGRAGLWRERGAGGRGTAGGMGRAGAGGDGGGGGSASSQDGGGERPAGDRAEGEA